MTYRIYKVTNTINNKIYVGLTKKTVEKRWIDHVSTANTMQKNGAFQYAIRKYGRASFSVETICSCINVDDAEHVERAFISEYDCISPRGYNLTQGGSANSGTTEATRSLQRAQMIHRLADPVYKKKLKDGRKAAWDKPEHRAIMLLAMEKKLQNPDHIKTLANTARQNSFAVWSNPERAELLRTKFKQAWIIRKARDFPHLVTT